MLAPAVRHWVQCVCTWAWSVESSKNRGSLPCLPGSPAPTSEDEALFTGHTHVDLITQPSHFVLTFLPFGECSLLLGTGLDELLSRALVAVFSLWMSMSGPSRTRREDLECRSCLGSGLGYKTLREDRLVYTNTESSQQVTRLIFGACVHSAWPCQRRLEDSG